MRKPKAPKGAHLKATEQAARKLALAAVKVADLAKGGGRPLGVADVMELLLRSGAVVSCAAAEKRALHDKRQAGKGGSRVSLN
jgi:hypothetical protein